jgi:FtsP/CotA-like multicopper oxidase with cupredoxin domain
MEGGVDPNDHGPNHMRVMMNAGSAWQFNKKAGDGHSGKPLFSVKRGTPVVLTIRNETAWPHAMHVHGHHFRTLFPFDDGWDPFWLDTSLVDARKVQRIAMVADNPGKWMIHCHMIEHQMAGMAGWFEVI